MAPAVLLDEAIVEIPIGKGRSGNDVQNVKEDAAPTLTSDPFTETIDFDAQLTTYNLLSRYLPTANSDHHFWWALTGRHVARMLHEAAYPLPRQIELLLFHRFHIVPHLGARPSSSRPTFWSRVAPGVGDGSPIGYSWRWGTKKGDKPRIRHYIEPIGTLTGTGADPLNETAAKAMLVELAGAVGGVELEGLWRFAAHIRPTLTDEVARKVSGSSMLVGLEWAPEQDSGIDVLAGLMTRAPGQVGSMMSQIFPAAMRDAYGEGTSLACLEMVREFVEGDEEGKKLTVLGTTALDCCQIEKSRFKVYVTTKSARWAHIESVMTLGGRKGVPKATLAKLKEVWYGVKGLPADFPEDAEPPAPEGGAPPGLGNAGPVGKAMAGGGPNANISGVTFYFDIHPKYAFPHVKLQVDVSKHAESDIAAIQAVTGFLSRRGQADEAQAYVNVVRGMVSDEELRTKKGLQAFFAFAVKNGEVDITSYFLPQVYRRFVQTQEELSPRGSRRSRFDSY